MSAIMKFVANGTYVAAKFSADTTRKIVQWAKQNDIPHPLEQSKLHCTIMDSAFQTIPEWHDLNKDVDGMNLDVVKIEIFPTRFKSLSGKPEGCLVFLLDAPEIVDMHNDLKARGGVHRFSRYDAHTAISYFVPKDIKVETIPLPSFKLHVEKIIAEPIDIDWLKH